ncbi:hypothetical protein AGMMS49965_08200 [Bacteroidia bacterium]|nr:hypothetical protein AGMMS49965_08200 [Bacteroidia bacterium]
MVEVMERIKSCDVEELMNIEAFAHALRMKKAMAMVASERRKTKASVKPKVSIADEMCGFLSGYEGNLDTVREDRLNERYGPL